MDHVKSILVFTMCSTALLTGSGFAQNLLTNGDFSAGLTGWTVTSADPLAASVAVGDGNPNPGLYLSRGPNSTLTLPNGAGQIFPAVAGRKYQLRGQWSGMIMGRNSVNDPNGTALVEIYVSFLPTIDTPYTGTGSPASSMLMKKRWQFPGTDPAKTFGVDPATGAWAWESISGSVQSGGNSEALIAPEGTNYMAVWTNFLCSVGNTSTTVYAMIDNLQVTSCQTFLAQDYNADCKVDFKDFAVLAGSWLACNLDPSSQCWN
jgi:hypothetical protein